MFTSGLRYRTPPYGKQEMGGICLWIMHRRALVSSVRHGEGHGISPTGCTAPLDVTVHQLPSRNSTLAGMKPLPRPSR